MEIKNKKEFKELINNNDTVIVDFWAEWCGPCRTVGPIMDEIISDKPTDFRVAKVDVTELGEIAGEYGIRNIPTVLLFKNGEPIDKIVGVSTKEGYINLARGK